MPSLNRIRTEHSYSAAVEAGELVFLALHRGPGDTFAEQLDATFDGLRETLAAFDLPVESLVKVNVWLRNIDDLWEMERRFERYFPAGGFPARMTATTEFVDDDCLVMVDGIAHRP